MIRTPGLAAILLVFCAAGCARPSMTNDPFSSPNLAPLADAVARGDAAEIRRLVAHTPPDTPGEHGATLLVAAIGAGNLVGAQTLLDNGADPNRPGGGGETPVHAAAFAADQALLQAVLAHGGDPNVRNPVTGGTALTRAILGQHPAQIRMLLDAGADPNLADRNEDAPLHTAARTNASDTILLLLDKGASPLAKNSGGATFQSYYFSFPRNVLNAEALSERRRIVAWLKAHHVPLEAGVEASY